MSANNVQWDSLSTIPPFSPVEGIQMQLLAGETIMMNNVTLGPGAVVPLHSHFNEQSGWILRGELAMTIAGETRDLTAGDCYMIPADVEHGAIAGAAGCVVLDIFAPPRADYVEQQRAAQPGSGS